MSYVILKDNTRVELPADRRGAARKVDELERSGRLHSFWAGFWRQQQKGSLWAPAALKAIADAANTAQRKSDAQRGGRTVPRRPAHPKAPTIAELGLHLAKLEIDTLADGLDRLN